MNVKRAFGRHSAGRRVVLLPGLVLLAILLAALPWVNAPPALAQSVTISQSSGPPGTSVTVAGSGFTDGDTYQITFAPATIYEEILAPSTTISGSSFSRAVTIPPAPWGQYTIAVTTNRGNFTPSFQVNPRLLLTASAGYVGDTVTVNGQGFRGNITVNIVFNGTTIVTTQSNTSGTLDSIDFTTPNLPRGNYNVYGMDGIATSPNVVFSILPHLTATPQEGSVGTQVQINGTGFGPNYSITVYWDSQVITSNIVTNGNGAFTTTVTVPTTTRGTHQISARDIGQATSTASFSVRPSITLSPANGTPGTTVSVTGQGFRPNATVRITYNGVNMVTQPTSITTSSTGSFSGSFIVPSVVSGSYAVVASDGIYSATATFGVASNIEISPTNGHVGSELVVNGTGFTPGGRVNINYDTQTMITVTAGSSGAFSASFSVPVSAAGAHTVSARDLTTQSVTASATFTMESTPPPTPSLLTPQYGSLTNTTPLFTWSPVSDASGVNYNLQVARDANFSQLVLFKQGLTQTQYQIASPEQLQLVKKDSPYYWRVQAVDLAGNLGDWTAPGSFFTQDSTPPDIPTLLGPPNDSQTGLRPDFTWSAVSDPSGVTYSLQVARDTAFTQLVIFKEGLTQPEYQVGPAEQLQLTKRDHPYYWRVRAVDGAQNASDWTGAALLFTEDSTPPPVPALLSPENGARSGAAVFFDWTDVSDPSSVNYTLEAAQDASFTYLVVYKEGLVKSEYKLASMEKLSPSTGSPPSPYYWRVRAVDGAGNASAWSTVDTFYVSGFQLRGWLLVAVLVVGGALVLAAGVFIGMRLRLGGPPEESE